MTLEEFKADFSEALNLLQMAGPNPLLVDSDEYWERYEKLTDKYLPPQEEDDE